MGGGLLVFIRDTVDPLHIVHEKLFNILKRAFNAATEHMRDSRAKIVQQVLQPGANFKKTLDRQQDVEAFHKQEADLMALTTQCQLKAMPFFIDSIKKNIRDAILDKDKDLCTVPKASEKFNKAIDNYFLKCIQFSWAAAFEELPPIQLVCDPKKECPKKSGSFANLNKVPRNYTVEWPALVQGDSIISPWILSERNQPRPEAPPNKDEEQVIAGHQIGEQVKPQSTSPIISSMPKMIPSPQHPQSEMSVKLQSDLAHKKHRIQGTHE